MGIAITLLGKEKIFKLIPPDTNNTATVHNVFYLMYVEAVFTFLLVSTVLFVKYRSVTSTSDGMLSNLTVAIGIYICIKMAGPLSGGGINPTIALAILTTDKVANVIDDRWHAVFYVPYMLGPIIGGTIAAGLLLLTRKLSPLDDLSIIVDEELGGEDLIPDQQRQYSLN